MMWVANGDGTGTSEVLRKGRLALHLCVAFVTLITSHGRVSDNASMSIRTVTVVSAEEGF